MQETLYQTADEGDNLSASGGRRHSIKQADAGDTLSDQTSDAGDTLITQRMQDTLYQTADAGVSQSDKGCRRHSIRCSRCLIECLLHPLGDRETSASAV